MPFIRYHSYKYIDKALSKTFHNSLKMEKDLWRLSPPIGFVLYTLSAYLRHIHPTPLLSFPPSVHLSDDGKDTGSRVLPGLVIVHSGTRADAEVVSPNPYLK